MKSDLYFFSVVPAQPQLDRLQLLKEDFADHYDCRAALRSPPHITLIAPFKEFPDVIAELTNDLVTWMKKQPGFELSLLGYGCFSPRVVYVKVVANSELSSLQTSLNQRIKSLLRIPFKGSHNFEPHLTLGTRDLSKTQFRQAWADLKDQDIEEYWRVEQVTLLKHNGRSWDVLQSFSMAPS